MNKIKLLLLFLILQLMFICPVLAGLEFNEELFIELANNKNEIPYIEIPDYSRLELENGMVVYLAEDKDLPIVEISGYIAGGIREESQESAGISVLMSNLMNTGTENFKEEELTKYKELNGVSLGIYTSYDNYNISGNSLSTEKEKLISLLAETLRNPKFDGDYYYRIIQEYIQLLMQQYYLDGSLLDMVFNTSLYGNHPYTNVDSIALIMSSFEKMTPEDVEEFYKKNIDPGKIVLAICGDIDIEETESIIKDYFEDWESQGVELNEEEVLINEDNFNKIVLVNKEDATHARMKMGYNFYNSSFEDRVPFVIANRIFGLGDFSSRLMDNLRTDLGYVYGIGSRMTLNQLGGLYFISTDVAPGNAYDAREAIITEILAIIDGERPIKEEELFRIVNQYNAFYPQSYQNQISILSKLIYDIEIMGEKGDTINSFVKEYNDLTAAQVQEVFVEHTFLERFLTVIVGRKDNILPAFEEKGIEVEVVELF